MAFAGWSAYWKREWPEARARYRVYALYDPRDPGHFRYVGCTKHSIRKRRSVHCSMARRGVRTPVARWIRTLLAAGVKPGYRTIERGRREGYVIIMLVERGHKLLNVHLMPRSEARASA